MLEFLEEFLGFIFVELEGILFREGFILGVVLVGRGLVNICIWRELFV